MIDSNISISLFRVSSDSKFLDFIFSCPRDYFFTSFILDVKHLGDKKEFITEHIDLSEHLFGDELSRLRKHWVLRIPLKTLGINYSAIYMAHLKAEPVMGLPFPFGQSVTTDEDGRRCMGIFNKYVAWNGVQIDASRKGETQEGYTISDGLVFDNEGNRVPGENLTLFAKWLGPNNDTCEVVYNPNPVLVNAGRIHDLAVCSDVNEVYKCLLDDILASADNNLNGGATCACSQLSDDAIRKYLILYGHLAALSVLDFQTAETYFRLLSNCFSMCNDKGNRNKCGCGCGSSNRSSISNLPSDNHSCNCGRK